MGLIFLILSTLLQAGAVVQSVRLALRQRRAGWVFAAVATTLMLARRAFTLHSVSTGQRSVDSVAEFIALLISSLLAIGLTMLLVWWTPVPGDEVSPEAIQRVARERLKRHAILLALMSLFGSTVLSYFAYDASREAVTSRMVKGSLDLAHMLATASSAAPDNRTALEQMGRLWRDARSEYPDNYLCVIGADGRLLFNTRRPETVGIESVIGCASSGAFGTKTIAL